MTAIAPPRTDRSADGPGSSRVTVFEVIGFTVSGLGMLWAIAAAVRVQPAFAKMFTSFGSELPLFTQLCLRPWFPIVLALFAPAITGLGIAIGSSTTARALTMGAAVLLTLGLPALFLIGMYLPIFAIAEAIK